MEALKLASTNPPRKIRKLDPTVVNRIAAGEVIQRPSNAIKELMENSLDAGASSIQISVKAGGMKLLQIQDDGSGINKADLEIVCERFTTSKLEKFEDLEEIGTYGFRGEALASISHVAHLRIVTKTAGSICAYQADYIDGKLKVLPGVANPKPCAGNKGTIIIAEDLFYNMEVRRRALKTPSDEHNRIVDVVSRYAVHNSQVGFCVKKAGEGNVDIRTPPKSTIMDNIRILYGGPIARELFVVKHEDEHFKLLGYTTNVNFSTKKFTFILFINHRLVESTAIRKAIDGVYTSYLPKGAHPFLYLSLEINPKNVDVNVHPTKNEVHFLHEDIIVSTIANKIESQLLGSNQSRTFYVQTMLPGASAIPDKNPGSSTNQGLKPSSKQQGFKDMIPVSTTASSSQRTLVRTDPKLQKLDKFLTSTPIPTAQNPTCLGIDDESDLSSIGKPNCNTFATTDASSGHGSVKTASSRDSESKKREIRLKSLKLLRQSLELDCSKDLVDMIRGHIFVGCVDRTRALIQFETKLFMVNTTRLSCELFYQKILWEFGNLGRIVINEPITIRELAMTALDAQEQNEPEAAIFDKEQKADDIQKLLLSKTAMLDDYFALKIDTNGRLRTLPLLLANYIPTMDGLPNYILNLADKVNWKAEKECFVTFAHQTAVFYAIPSGNENENEVITQNNHSWKWTIEHVFYPEAKMFLLPPKRFTNDYTVVQLANLPDMYKVFERC